MLIRLTTDKTLEIREGETLQNAFKRQGIYLMASCGGKGTCGKCKVRVLDGKVRTMSAAKLQPAEIDRGVVLACQTFAEGDISVEIPKESKLAVGDVIEIARSQDLLELFRASDGRLSPIVRWIDIDLPPPTIDNNISDAERLKSALPEKLGSELGFPHSFISSLPHSLRDAGWKVKLGYARESACFLKPALKAGHYGIAVDIGTTTLVVYLVNLEDGSIIDVGSTYNSQIRYGDDVITRIVYATEGGGLEELRKTVTGDIRTLLAPLAERHGIDVHDIESAVISGNTTMTHLMWGIDPQFIREEPYTPAISSFPLWTAGEALLPVNDNAPVFTLPCVASYVGGDIVAGVLASKLYRNNELALFLDIGTNGEIVLGNKDWLVTAACSAGPCFEGSGIRDGMRATEGAVESVKIDPLTFEPELGVIGRGRPLGICGSGMIDAITEMFLTGIIDQRGRIVKDIASGRVREGIEGPEFVFYSDGRGEVVLTEVDIENIMRAKAAIFAGVSLLLRETGFTLDDVGHVYIAGGFGNYLNVGKAILIGMLPDIPREKFVFLGNTSVAGAYLCLLSEKMRRDADEVARKMTNIELSVSRQFMDEYMSALFLPHTDISLFPTVDEILKKRH